MVPGCLRASISTSRSRMASSWTTRAFRLLFQPSVGLSRGQTLPGSGLSHLPLVGLESASRLLNDTGLFLLHRARLSEARALPERALAIDEQVYGPEHPDVARDANNIGQILKA